MNKKELRFAIMWIVIYVVGMSVFEAICSPEALEKLRIIPSGILMIVMMLVWKKKGGFRTDSAFPWRETLYLLPMIFLATVNLWGGVVIRYEPVTLICYVASMLMVGFVEEILFRGLLLEALQKQGSLKSAIVISSLTFGLGHIVNLLNGSEFIPTLLQLIYAAAIGVMLSVFTVTVKNILPCCLFHGVFNALSAFHSETLLIIGCQVILCVIISAVSLGYAAYLWKRQDSMKGEVV